MADARRKIGVVFQQFNLIRRRSALDNVIAGRLADAALWRVLLGAALCTLHRPRLAEQFADRVLVMGKGAIAPMTVGRLRQSMEAKR